MTPPHRLAMSTWDAVRSTAFEVVVLPWGATEAHNRHLPYGTDTIECDAVAALAARKAWDRGARVLVLPTVPFGVQTGQRDIPFCLNLNPSTQTRMLADLIRSIEPHGARKLVILNGHGGNDFRQIVREVQPETRLFLCQVNWYAVLDPAGYFDQPGDHAGELETSVMQHIAPDLVAPLDQAGPGTARQPVIRAFREKWAWAPRPWTAVTDDTGVGDPRAATGAKGARFVEAVTDRLAEFLDDLARADPDAMYR